MQKILVLSGPTGVGKTALAVKLAQKFNGELISADSRQIYKGMDIGTGKDTDQIWLLDVVFPDQPFSVADYQKLAHTVIKDIWKRGKLPILVGGTGLYIKSIIDGIGTVGIPQNQKLREKLSKLSLSDLQKTLQSNNPYKWNSMNSSDQQNSRRLVRAIEIASSKMLPAKDKRLTANSQTIHLALTAPNEILYQRIDDRVEKRVKQGIINEIKSLLSKGYTWDLPSMSACGYRVWEDYFEKKATLAETIQKWKFEEHDYARRQLTWFKKDKRVRWFDITKNDPFSSLVSFLSILYP